MSINFDLLTCALNKTNSSCLDNGGINTGNARSCVILILAIPVVCFAHPRK